MLSLLFVRWHYKVYKTRIWNNEVEKLLTTFLYDVSTKSPISTLCSLISNSKRTKADAIISGTPAHPPCDNFSGLLNKRTFNFLALDNLGKVSIKIKLWDLTNLPLPPKKLLVLCHLINNYYCPSVWLQNQKQNQEDLEIALVNWTNFKDVFKK